jgi:putative tricarboxylic transport membrane protein
VPVILGTLLGNTMENNLRRAVTISNGDYGTLIDSPLSIGLWTVAVVGFILPIFVGRMVKARMHARRDTEGSLSD